ncbi:hypothetical protein FACS1894191_3900 [Clostridia bacterium]|nr:hypothetical protein FACS1894191_3900 [Clostridia bacterium]
MGWITTNTVIIILLLISIIVSIFTLYVTIHNCRSEKKSWFVFCLIGMLLYILGNFIEVTSRSTEAALIGVKVMYVGSCFMSPLFLLFTADYCEFYIKKILRIAIFIVPAVHLVLLWTTEYTHLIYREFAYTADATVRGLQIISQGPFYYLVYGYALLCISASAAIIVSRMFKWNKSLRFPLFLLLLSAMAPLLANVIYALSSYIFHSDLHGVNLTPFALIITNFFFYINVLRHDLFDLAPRARSATLDMIRDGFVFLDEQMNYTSSNEIALSLFPGLRKLGRGMPITNLEAWPKELESLDVNSMYKNIQFSLPDADDQDARVFNAWVRVVRNGGKILGIIILIQDITDNIRLMKHLESDACTDGLTGLFNRKHFMELVSMQLKRAKREGSPSCVLLFDLDFFKKVNDVHGHLAGDEVLRFVADQVKRTLRAYDIVARYGGEEFVVFLADTDSGAAVHLAERIRENIASSLCVYEDVAIPVTCSIGVTEAVGDISIDDILKKADQAMYQAKGSGRNRVCVL